jgi:TolA-binding protein
MRSRLTGAPAPPAASTRSRLTGAPARSRSADPVPATDAPVAAERLAEEVALVDRARGALARGDASAAVAALDAYEAHFTERRFAPESLYLRMESLLALGRAADARAVAARLAAAHPTSPQAARARQVLSETIP